MSTEPAPAARLELTLGKVTSQGAGLDELTTNLASARPDQTFIPLLVNAGILPDRFEGMRVLPAVAYGVRSRRLDSGAVELLPGTDTMISETFGSDYFNPHLALRARAGNLINSAKHPRQAKVSAFTLPSYVLGSGEDRNLFIGGSDDDIETLPKAYVHAIARAYGIGNIAVGSEVVVGKMSVKMGKTSLPTLIREIGQTIGSTKGLMGSTRVQMLQHARDNLSNRTSPDYRPFLSLRRR